MSAPMLAHFNEQAFAGRTGWQRIHIDPPGHGATPGAEWITTLDDVLDLMMETITALIDDRPFAILGYSLGAYLARGVLYHRQSNVLGIAMVAPVIEPDTPQRNVPPHTVVIEDPGIMDSLHPDEVEMFEFTAVRTNKFLNNMRNFPQQQEGAAGDMDFLTTIREDPDCYQCSFDIDDLQRPFPAPALIVAGRQDAVVGYKDAWDILDNYPRATYVVVDRAGHFMEEKEEFNGLLLNEWLDRVEEYANQETS